MGDGPKYPPLFAELGKEVRDLFGKGYHFDLLKVDAKTKTESEVDFGFTVVNNLLTNNLVGNLEAKYKFKDYDLTFLEKWSSDSTIATELTLEKPEGAKWSGEVSLKPRLVENPPAEGGEAAEPKTSITVDKSFSAKSQYRTERISFNGELEFKTKGGYATSFGIATTVKGVSIGWSSGYNVSRGEFSEKLAAEHANDLFTMGLSLANFNLLTGSVFWKQLDPVVIGIQGSLALDSRVKNDLGFAVRCKLNDEALFRFKVNALEGRLGMGYSHKLKDGVTIYLSALLPGLISSDRTENDYHFGFCVELSL